MAWIDDTFYSQPKVHPLTDAAFRAYVVAVCYCNHHDRADGTLRKADIRFLNITAKSVRELTAAGLWHPADEDGVVEINDFREHNERRLERRRQDRERKRKTNGSLREDPRI